ncbi:hypothetical protein PSYMO_37976, partial [Pseudomonas amygdali pv. mori str. 301020]
QICAALPISKRYKKTRISAGFFNAQSTQLIFASSS